MFVFRKIWRALISWNTRFEIRPFALLPTNFTLTPEKTVTYLSIEIDENLPWNKKMEIFTKQKDLAEQNKLYFVEAKISYFKKKTWTLINYILFHVTKNMKILVLQKKYTRLLTFSDYREHNSPIFKFLKVLKLEDIIQFGILKLIYFY